MAPVALRLPNGGYYALRNDSHARLKARIAPMVPTFSKRAGHGTTDFTDYTDWESV